MTETLRAAIYGGLIGAASPILIVTGGASYRLVRLYLLRSRQRDAIRKICDLITALGNFSHPNTVVHELNRIRAHHEFYSRVLFSGRTPLGLIEQILELNALVASLFEFWARNETKCLAGDMQTDLFKPFGEKAMELRLKASFVLFTL